MSTYVFGHTNPDSDSIVGAISLSYLKNQLGEDCIPTRQGKVSPETEFILDKFNGTLPELKTSYAGEDVYIVDYSDLAQAPEDILEATILGPVGCSNTVIKEMYDAYDVEIPKDIAGMMLCAILSDTVIFKSPTCTKVDTKACKELAKIAGVEDYKALGMEMFIVKSAVKGATARELTTRDYKEFAMGSEKVGVGQLEVVDLSVFDEMKDDLFADIAKLKEEGGLHTVMLLLTDIMKEGSQILVVSDDVSKIEGGLNVKLENDQAWLDGVLSRKKQIIPFIQPQF